MKGTIEVGHTYTVKSGRRKNEEVSVTKIIDNNFVFVKTKKGKERKFSMLHLEPMLKKN